MLFSSFSKEGDSRTFSDIYEKELRVIKHARKRRGINSDIKPEKNLVALAFSGGGIRSATFNLGVLQAFARSKLLTNIDYLSTVSGGGYIGSWLSSWAYRIKESNPKVQNQIAEIEERLNQKHPKIGDVAEPEEVHMLRKYSNYLTPQLGMLSGDTLAFVGNYLRNLLLNQFILISLLLVLLLIPRLIGLVFARFAGGFCSEVCFGLAIVFLLIALVSIQLNLQYGSVEGIDTAGKGEAGYRTIFRRIWRGNKSAIVFWLIAMPLFFFCFLLAYAVWGILDDTAEVHRYLISNLTLDPSKRLSLIISVGVFYAILWLIATGASELQAWWRGRKQDGVMLTKSKAISRYSRWVPVIGAFPSGLLGGALLVLINSILGNWPPIFSHSVWYLLTFGVPMYTATMLLVAVVHIGIIGRNYDELVLEWFARLGGIVLAIVLFWFLLCFIAFFLPFLFLWFWTVISSQSQNSGWVAQIKQICGSLGITAAIGGWITATLKGLVAAKSSQTGGAPQQTATAGRADLWARIAPSIFVVGLIAILSLILHSVVPMLDGLNPDTYYWELLSASAWWRVLILAAILVVVFFFLGYRVDVNQFSLHNAYRNRLVRCYLGATNRNRRAQFFTGFDENDDIRMDKLLKLGAPFHIVNATLNVTKGKELALQARKARSFIFTPLYSGFDYIGDESIADLSGTAEQEKNGHSGAARGSYRLSMNCSWQSPRYAGGRLGSAMAISGAAISPNMGHYSTGAVSFLLTVFCVRLGWWLGNPLEKKFWERKGPRRSWNALIRELTGTTRENKSEIYLSDGGHFDNLGIYELVRRRCKTIIVCDAGADHQYAFDDLTAVIEKCRVDFNTEITIDIEDIYPAAQVLPNGQSIQASKRTFAVGEIVYPDEQKGRLIYIKPTLNANLPLDVLAYARLNNTFPHQTTMDQFFDEEQFESYRSLGFACASEAIQDVGWR